MPSKKTNSKTKSTTNTEPGRSAGDAIADLSFENAMEDLDTMIERIESGEIGLEESLNEYERGMALFGHCRSILKQAEQRFEKLRIKDQPPSDSS